MSITLSVVSHGHGVQVGTLLRELAALDNPDLRRVIVTHNIPEPDFGLPGPADLPFELKRIVNTRSAGFGANHNQAFAEDTRLAASDHFAVVNPDVRLLGDPFPPLLQALERSDHAACAYAVQVDAQGKLRDHERRLPTPLALLRRYAQPPTGLRLRDPDWVNAAFLLFASSVFARFGGFDTRYHMYCEDVDLCLRLQLGGMKIVRATESRVVHEGRRATRSSLRHLSWHVASLLRLWNSDTYRDFKRLRRAAR